MECMMFDNLKDAEAAKKLLNKNRIQSHICLDREQYRAARFQDEGRKARFKAEHPRSAKRSHSVMVEDTNKRAAFYRLPSYDKQPVESVALRRSIFRNQVQQAVCAIKKMPVTSAEQTEAERHYVESLYAVWSFPDIHEFTLPSPCTTEISVRTHKFLASAFPFLFKSEQVLLGY